MAANTETVAQECQAAASEPGSSAQGKSTTMPKRKALTPREKVSRSQKKVLTAMPEIVEKLCEVAKTGNHMVAKFVFDFARITDLQSPLEEPPSADSLAGILLDKLQSDQPANPAPGAPSGTIE